MKVYHRTSAAEAILREGFIDHSGSYMCTDMILTGVFVSDKPLDGNEGANGEFLLAMEIPDATFDQYELVNEGFEGTYRESCIPAAVLNQCGPPTIEDCDCMGCTEQEVAETLQFLRQTAEASPSSAAYHLDEVRRIESLLPFLRSHNLLASS